MRHVTTVAVHGMIIGTAMMNAPDVLHACAKVYKWVNSHDNGQKRWVPTVLMICVIGTTCRAAEGAAQMTAAMACAHGCVRATQRLRMRCRAVTARWRAEHDARVRRQERAAAHAAARATVWARVGMRRPVTLPFTKRQTTRSRIHKRAVIMFIAVTITVATAARLNAEIAGVMHAIVLLRAGDVEPHPGPTAGAPATPAKAPDRTVIGKRAQRRAARGKGGLMRVGTLNAPGIHVRRTDRTGSERDEGWGDGWYLKTMATPKLAAVRDAMQQRLITVMSLTETRLRAEELSAVGGFFQRVGYQHAGLPGSDTVSGHTVWGVSLVWDQGRMRMVDTPYEVVPHRVLRVTLEVIGDKKGTRMTVYGVYMPQRGCNDGSVAQAWQALEDDACTRPNPWVVGDMNAEVRSVRMARRSKAGHTPTMGESDNRMAQMMDHVNLQYTGTGEPTHQKGTEIDHVLVSMRNASSTSKAKVAPGVCGKDHKLVWVDHYFEIDSEGCGPTRAVGPKLDKVTDKEWEKYNKAAHWWAETELVSQAYNDMTVH